MRKPNQISPQFGLPNVDAAGTHFHVVRFEGMKLQWSGADAGFTESKPPCGLMHVRLLAVSVDCCMSQQTGMDRSISDRSSSL